MQKRYKNIVLHITTKASKILHALGGKVSETYDREARAHYYFYSHSTELVVAKNPMITAKQGTTEVCNDLL